MNHPASHIFEFTPDSLAEWCVDRGLAKYRAEQILEWVYVKGVADPHEMSNLGKGDRDLLASEMTFESCDVLTHQLATDGTQKMLVEWREEGTKERRHEGTEGEEGAASLRVVGSGGDPARQTECVMIPAEGEEKSRRTACISSQVGCPVGCRFCASGLGGLDGNLSAGRIVEQVWKLARLEGVGRITNVVFMGMGEPLANLPAVIPAVRTLAAPWGLGVGARKITISTVGLPKAILNLADQLDLPVTLALSLHAPTDELRRKLIPWSEYTTIDELFAACRAWFAKTGREITLEYILLGGVNDRKDHASALAALAKTLRANVNLIRYNEVDGLPFRRPISQDVHEFQRILRARGVNSHIRASRGRDIAAACGQLRHEAQTS